MIFISYYNDLLEELDNAKYTLTVIKTQKKSKQDIRLQEMYIEMLEQKIACLNSYNRR